MLTAYEKKQFKLAKEWHYQPPPIIGQAWDYLFLPQPGMFAGYMPLEAMLAELEAIPQLQEAAVPADLVAADRLAQAAWQAGLKTPIKERDAEVVMDFLLDIPEIIRGAVQLVGAIHACYGQTLATTLDLTGILQAVSGKPPAAMTGEPAASTHTLPQVAMEIGLEIAMRKFMVQNPYLRIFLGPSAARWYWQDVGLAAQRHCQLVWFAAQRKVG